MRAVLRLYQAAIKALSLLQHVAVYALQSTPAPAPLCLPPPTPFPLLLPLPLPLPFPLSSLSLLLARSLALALALALSLSLSLFLSLRIYIYRERDRDMIARPCRRIRSKMNAGSRVWHPRREREIERGRRIQTQRERERERQLYTSAERESARARGIRIPCRRIRSKRNGGCRERPLRTCRCVSQSSHPGCAPLQSADTAQIEP
jgi:hypothetical protein